MIRKKLPKADLTIWVPGQHDSLFDAQHTLFEESVSKSRVNIVVNRVSLVRTSRNFMDLAVCP